MAAPKSKTNKPTNGRTEVFTSVQKIAPYPIEVNLWKVDGTPPWKGSIVKMTEVGFLMRVTTLKFYKVSEDLQLEFTLPVVGSHIRCHGKVVKTYDAVEAAGPKDLSKFYTVEVHFKAMIEKEKQAIIKYLVKSGQKKF
jgi:hypothetical protein